jgi:DNA (cytosine-5)-methyltransferase 1
MAAPKNLSFFFPPAKMSGRPLPRCPPRNELGLFAGIGGFELGLKEAGHKTHMLCEIWEPAVAVLKERFPGVDLVEDVMTLAKDPGLIPDKVDLLTAGFPCTDLSQAGMTAGLEGKNSGLVYQVFRILGQRRVPWVIIENVPFMLSLNRGRAMGVIVDELERLGYKWAYRVIDSRAFGVPQRRQRVFLIASLDGDPRDVLLSEDVGPEAEPTKDEWKNAACGFYWTEGVRGLGWAHDAVPTLKGGSTVGIPSSPAIAMPDGRLVTPTISDVERMQGFDPGWTSAAASVSRKNFRWKLVGNAVTVDVAKWLGQRLQEPLEYDPTEDERLCVGRPWPTAAYNVDGQRFVAPVSEWPMRIAREPLVQFLGDSELELLSARATRGFLNRATSDACNLRFPPGFLDFVRRHLVRVETL